jgi:hypothetical protein
MIITKYFPAGVGINAVVLDENLEFMGRVQEINTETKTAVVRRANGKETIEKYAWVFWFPPTQEDYVRLNKIVPRYLRAFILQPEVADKEAVVKEVVAAFGGKQPTYVKVGGHTYRVAEPTNTALTTDTEDDGDNFDSYDFGAAQDEAVQSLLSAFNVYLGDKKPTRENFVGFIRSITTQTRKELESLNRL